MDTPLIPEGLLTFHCPFENAVSPEVDEIAARCLAWSQQYDLGDGDRHKTMMYGYAGAGVSSTFFPNATGELAQALADYSAWAFRANDIIVPDLTAPMARQAANTVGRWNRIIRSLDPFPFTTQHPHEAALRDTFLRLRDTMTPIQYHRFAALQIGGLWEMVWNASLRESGKELTVNDYLALRIGDAGGYAVIGYIDASQGIECPEHERSTALVQAALEAGMYVAALDNDRYSYVKESGSAQTTYSILDAMRHDHPDFSAQQITDACVALRDAILHTYLQLRERVLAAASTELRRYFDGIDLMISGNIHFGTTSIRYFAPGAAPAVQILRRAPAPPPPGPLPYPTLAWWWKHLA